MLMATGVLPAAAGRSGILMSEKSTPPSIKPIGGMITSLTRDCDDGAEGAADDDADRHVDDVAPDGELSEFLQHAHADVSSRATSVLDLWDAASLAVSH